MPDWVPALGDFYPRPPRGGRRACLAYFSRANLFLSTPSARRATERTLMLLLIHTNFYPRPPRGGRPSNLPGEAEPLEISIHALREEGDIQDSCNAIDAGNFYPRPPRGGRRPYHTHLREKRGISIHALREEGDGLGTGVDFTGDRISIHALREEGDGPDRRCLSWA